MRVRVARTLRLVALASASVLLLDVALSVFFLRDGRLLGRFVPPVHAAERDGLAEWIANEREELSRPLDERDAGEFDAELGWTHRAGFRSLDGRRAFGRLGARGARGYADVPPAGVVRLAFFGESFTLCAQVEDEETFQARLEARRSDVEAVNFGVNGYGQDQALLRFRREGRHGAHAVFLGLMLENIGRNVNRSKQLWQRSSRTPGCKPRFVLADDELRLVPQPFDSIETLLAALEDGTYAERLAEHEHWSEPELGAFSRSSLARIAVSWLDGRRRSVRNQWLAHDEEPYRVTLALLESFHREAVASGADFAGVLLFALEPDWRRAGAEDERYWTGLLADLERRAIPVLDLCSFLAAASVRGECAGAGFYSGVHHSPCANELIAAELERWLIERGVLPR